MPEDMEQSGKTAWARFFDGTDAVLTIAAVVAMLPARPRRQNSCRNP